VTNLNGNSDLLFSVIYVLDHDLDFYFSSDYHGALNARMHALLLRRSGDENRTESEDLRNVHVVNGLWDVVEWVAKRNDTQT
jgi:hypothetical protein